MDHGEAQGGGIRHAISNKRNEIRDRRTVNLIYRIGVGVVGTAVLALGIVAIPYPGPGWLIVFAGLGILATEFAWAHRLLTFAKGKYDAWMEWVQQQHWSVQALLALLTFAIVVGTLWLLGALELAAGWVGIEWSWLQSPIL
ncbi:TIGR02611 family protein [Williamsia sp.]|uniref:TIGR02611 family protein n=1 Tax=Williamsia sp. TaxID=1872085 RepID=UPI002F928940